jgi:hypothetical protein
MSLPHFSVTSTSKFWGLDTDDFIFRDDFMTFNDSALSPIICERFINVACAPQRFTGNRAIDFQSFAYLLLWAVNFREKPIQNKLTIAIMIVSS